MPRHVSNPPNPWRSEHVEWLAEPPAEPRVEVYEEQAGTVLSHNDSPDLSFNWSVNPYRGCFHGCAYCYARPAHQYLDWGAGTDFERKIVAKVNAPEVLRRELGKRSWRGETLAFSGVTDCYQPLEASYSLTRGCLEVCLDHRQPIAIVTKGVLIRRDVDLLARLAELNAVRCVYFSVPFARSDWSRKIEPSVALPQARFTAMSALAKAGVPVGISVSPTIPGLNDRDIPELLERAADAGANRAFMTMLRLPAEVLPVFVERLQAAFPDRAERVLSGIRDQRGGKLDEGGFGSRMVGRGPRWDVTRQLFTTYCARLGIDDREQDYDELPTTFRRPGEQLELF